MGRNAQRRRAAKSAGRARTALVVEGGCTDEAALAKAARIGAAARSAAVNGGASNCRTGTPAESTHAEPDEGEDEDEGMDTAKWRSLSAAMERLASATRLARSTALAEEAAYAAAIMRGAEFIGADSGILGRLMTEFQQGGAAMRAERIRLLFQAFGLGCPGMLELHATGRPGECSEDDCAGGVHLDTYSCGSNAYGCEDCEIEMDDDEDDPERSGALAAAMAQIDAHFGQTGTDG